MALIEGPESIFDNDLYKFLMQWAVICHQPDAIVKYEFIDRRIPITRKWSKLEILQLQKIIWNMGGLGISDDEQDALYHRKEELQLPEVYIRFLSNFRYNPETVKISEKYGELKITITGYWWEVILWEVPLLAIVSEFYNKNKEYDLSIVDIKATEKCIDLNNENIKFSEFGTRRRRSFKVQSSVIKALKAANGFLGTSNLRLAIDYNCPAIGTQAHEWWMFYAAKDGYKNAYLNGMADWQKTYKNPGILLVDTFTTDHVFSNEDILMSYNWFEFSGIRQDSGDPLEITKKFKNSPFFNNKKNKIVFSDRINSIEQAIKLHRRAKKLSLDPSFGIGTYFTHDFSYPAPNIVIKMVAVWIPEEKRWQSTVKLSDSKGKHLGSQKEIKKCKKELGL